MPIAVKDLTFVYSKKTPYEKIALDDISFSVKDGEFIGLVGSTGSGKSTLIQHLNGLIRLQKGSITVGDIDLSAKKVNLKLLRSGIGMLFQYPEYQLFEETVLKDVLFGPKNFGMSEEEALASAREAIEQVGLNFEDIKERSPFELSGGQKRRVAIAGVLAYKPRVLILDEPTGGLDPAGKRETLSLIRALRDNRTVDTVIMISHNMDEIAEFTDRVLVLNDSKLLYDMPTAELFSKESRLTDIGLALPVSVKLWMELKKRGYDAGEITLTVEAFADRVLALYGGGKNA